MRHDHIFDVADTLGMTLFEKDNDVSGSMKKRVQMGPWQGNAHVYAQSDFVTHDSCGVLVKLRKSLWAYVLSFNPDPGLSGAPKSQLYLILFDGKAAGAKTGDLKAFTTGKLADTMAKIKPHAAKVFKYDGSWLPSTVSPDDLVGQVPG